MPLGRRLGFIVVYTLAFLTIANRLGWSLTPVLTGLGLSGLAVALALQPTLSNLIVSAWLAGDGTLSVGDIVEVQGGPAGTVTDVSWRTTRIMTPAGNIVMIPNSTLVNSTVTNLNSVTPEMNAVVNCGVSYDVNLARVRDVCLEVCRETANALGDSVVVRSFEPLVRFREFGDSNITFILIMRATNRGNTFLIQHELVMRLHERFGREGIEINYPVRKLVLPPELVGGQQAAVLTRPSAAKSNGGGAEQ
ncbi:MAG: mechanosensitive ion channel family protein [SAR202 cluster bacterium]|nr:mechanosensitive ion channel family protein [SAR202 cluster bacterium]